MRLIATILWKRSFSIYPLLFLCLALGNAVGVGVSLYVLIGVWESYILVQALAFLAHLLFTLGAIISRSRGMAITNAILSSPLVYTISCTLSWGFGWVEHLLLLILPLTVLGNIVLSLRTTRRLPLIEGPIFGESVLKPAIALEQAGRYADAIAEYTRIAKEHGDTPEALQAALSSKRLRDRI